MTTPIKQPVNARGFRTSFDEFIREVEVLVGPLPEHEGGGSPDKALRFFGDGSNDNFRIRFQVRCPISPCSVFIYNLKEDTRSALLNTGMQITLNVGWRSATRYTIFQGALLNCRNERQGADIVTELMFLPGFVGTYQKFISGTFTGGKLVSDIVFEIASSATGITVDRKNINLYPKYVTDGGYSYAGTVEKSLTELSRIYGFTWWIDRKVFHATDDSIILTQQSAASALNAPGTTVSLPLISGKNGNLLRAEPIMIPPTMQKNRGIYVQCVFNPFVHYMGLYQLESTLNKNTKNNNINGIWQAHAVSHYGDTHSDQWVTEIQSTIAVDNKIVAPIPMQTTKDNTPDWTDQEVLAGTIYGEARGESNNGKIAVGLTIRTRVKNPGLNNWGSTWREVMLRKGQFICWHDQNVIQIVNARQQKPSMWNTCLDIANRIYSGEQFNVGLSANPTNYFNPNIVRPSWAAKLISVGTIGNHDFYRDSRAVG